MLFYYMNRNKSIKYLRKNASYTCRELAIKLKCKESLVNNIDSKSLKEIPKELRDRLIPIFRGDKYDNVPW